MAGLLALGLTIAGGEIARASVLTPNLLGNGGFEAGKQGWTALNPSSGGLTQYQAYGIAAQAQAGTWFMQANTNPDGGSLYQDIPVSLHAGDSATFSMWARRALGTPETGREVLLCLWGLPATSACQLKRLSAHWQQIQTTTTMSGDTSALRAQMYMNGRGNIDYDSGVVARNLLRDGGFEGGGQGWAFVNPPGFVGPAPAGALAAYNYPSGAHDGAWFLEANTNPDQGSVVQDVPVSLSSGDTATFSIWARRASDNPGSSRRVNLCLWSLPAAKNACQSKVLTERWHLLTATATMPAATTTLRAQLYMAGRGNFNFDGAHLGDPQIVDAAYPPVSAGPPAITGKGFKGQRLVCSPGSWTDGPTSFSFRWTRDGAPIGAGPAFTTTGLDIGHRLGCVVTASNIAGEAAREAPSIAIRRRVTPDFKILIRRGRLRVHPVLKRSRIVVSCRARCGRAKKGKTVGRILRAHPRKGSATVRLHRIRLHWRTTFTVKVTAPDRVGRFRRYRLARLGNGLFARPVKKGCLDQRGKSARC